MFVDGHLQIVTAGVTIVTLLDQRSYSVASLNMNPTDLIISLVYMMRANEESETKSVRLKSAWAARRDRPGNTYHGGQCPGWIRPNGTTATIRARFTHIAHQERRRPEGIRVLST